MILHRDDIDFLTEFTTICVGHAANRIALMAPLPIMISRPSVIIGARRSLPSRQSAGADILLGIAVTGHFVARIYISMTRVGMTTFTSNIPDSMRFLVDSGDLAFFESMVREIGNILSSAYTTAVEQFTGLVLIPSIPVIMGDGHEQSVNSPVSDGHDALVLLSSDLYFPSGETCSRFLTVLAEEEVTKILAKKRWIT
jgi:chemotaxis protein CheY-P-specific phosphatase CheC